MNANQYKCGSCDKIRNRQRFSSTSIRKYEDSVRKSQRSRKTSDIKLPKCQDCSGQPRHELECAKCSVVKSLDAFSKQMRKNPDNAECIDCVQEREDREPDHRVETEEQEIIEKLKNGIPPTVYASTRGTLLGFGHQSHVLSNSHGLTAFSDADEGGWIQPPVEVPDDPRNRSQTPSEISGRMRRLSINSSATQETFRSNTTSKTTGTAWDQFERVNAPYREQVPSIGGRISNVSSNTSQGMNNPGFAKQRAVKQDQLTKAQIQLQREQKRKQEQEEQEGVKDSDSDDDDDDSDSDPDAKYGY